MSEPRPKRLPLVIVILTLNEARHLPECLGSAAGLAERVLVVDSGSDDETVEIARQLDADVITHPFAGYASQRNLALQSVEQPWVLFLDADERLTPELRLEIAETIETVSQDVAGYWIPRRNLMFGRELRGGGWSPDWQLRLLRRDRAQYQTGREVHEIVELKGYAGYLKHALIHHNYDSYREFVRKQTRYAEMQAEMYRTQGLRPRRRSLVGQPAREFWRRFVTHHGYRDGLIGLALASGMARAEFQTWREVWRRSTDEEHDVTRSSAEPATISPRPIHSSPAFDISVVVVSYNVRDLLLACLASIEASLAISSMSAEVIVVDNGSTDASVDSVRRRFPNVTLLENAENLGFAAANNRGITQARGRSIVLLNPDTTVVGDAFGILVRYLDGHPDVGVVGPRLLYPDGTTQSSRRRFPTRLTSYLESTIIQDYWRRNRVLDRYYVSDRPDNETQDVDWLVGACLVVRREVFAQVGLFDERFFMYSEEVEWSHRVRCGSWRIVYLPEAQIVHREGSSSRQDVPGRQINFDTSKVLLVEALHGRTDARLLRGFLLGSYLVRIMIESTKALLGHKPALRRQRVRSYARVFRSGLRGDRR